MECCKWVPAHERKKIVWAVLDDLGKFQAQILGTLYENPYGWCFSHVMATELFKVDSPPWCQGKFSPNLLRRHKPFGCEAFCSNCAKHLKDANGVASYFMRVSFRHFNEAERCHWNHGRYNTPRELMWPLIWCRHIRDRDEIYCWQHAGSRTLTVAAFYTAILCLNHSVIPKEIVKHHLIPLLKKV